MLVVEEYLLREFGDTDGVGCFKDYLNALLSTRSEVDLDIFEADGRSRLRLKERAERCFRHCLDTLRSTRSTRSDVDLDVVEADGRGRFRLKESVKVRSEVDSRYGIVRWLFRSAVLVLPLDRGALAQAVVPQCTVVSRYTLTLDQHIPGLELDLASAPVLKRTGSALLVCHDGQPMFCVNRSG